MDIMDQIGKEGNHLDQTDLKWNWNHIEIEWNYLDQVGTEWKCFDQNGINWNYLDKIVYLESENIRV